MNFRQLSMHVQDHSSVSGAFCLAAVPSVKLLQLSVLLRDLPSTFRAAVGLSVNFRQLSGHSQDILSTSRVLTGLSVKLHQLSMRLRDVPSAFCVVVILAVNFCELFVQTSTLHQISFRPWDRPSISVNFTCVCGTFRQLPTTFRLSTGPSVNISCIHKIFRQLFVWMWELP